MANREDETKKYLQLSFNSASENCRPGPGRDRALRSIYFAVLNFRGISPSTEKVMSFPNDNHLRFMDNRKRYIEGMEMVRYNFTDWKYYLHYTLALDHEHMMRASEQWPQLGRLIA